MFPSSGFASFESIRLDVSDAPRLQPFFASCEDYFRMVSGEAAGPDEAARELRSLPPGKTLADKFFLALLRPDGSMAGVLDLVKDYPEPGIWYLGLLLLDPSERGKGHGATLHAQLRACLHEQGGNAIRLGVLEQNTQGMRFWERLGYRELTRKPYQAGSLTSTVRVMQLELHPDPAPPRSGET